MNIENNDKNVDSSSQALSKEIKHDSPMNQDPNNVPDFIPPSLTPKEVKKYEDIAKQLEGNDSTAVPSTQGEMINGEIKKEDKGMNPSFKDVYDLLGKKGPVHIKGSQDGEYEVTAEIKGGNPTIYGNVISGSKKGDVRIHEDCWGYEKTCKGTWAGGIYNGEPSIYDWYKQNK